MKFDLHWERCTCGHTANIHAGTFGRCWVKSCTCKEFKK